MDSGTSAVIEKDEGRFYFEKDTVCSNTSSCLLLYLRKFIDFFTGVQDMQKCLFA